MRESPMTPPLDAVGRARGLKLPGEKLRNVQIKNTVKRRIKNRLNAAIKLQEWNPIKFWQEELQAVFPASWDVAMKALPFMI